MREQVSFEVSAPARRGAARVAPERRMAWSEWGPADGAPVLFSPGAATSCSLGFAGGALERLGARLIAVDRPGLGGSDPAPGRTLLDTAADVRALAAALALERPAIVGFSQGAPLALACAAAGAVSAVAVVSGTDELAGPALRGLLPPEILRLVELAEADPPAAEALFRGMTPAIAARDDRAAAPRWTSRSTASRRSPPPSPPRSTRALSGDRTASRATRCWRCSAGRSIRRRSACRCTSGTAGSTAAPSTRWTSARRSRDRIPGAARTVIEGAGGSILWTHGAEILAALLEARRAAGT